MSLVDLNGDFTYNGQDILADMNANFDALETMKDATQLASSASITPDQDDGVMFKLTLDQNATLNVFDNLKAGSSGYIEVDNPAAYTLGVDTGKFKTKEGVINLNTYQKTILSYVVVDATPSSEIIYIGYTEIVKGLEILRMNSVDKGAASTASDLSDEGQTLSGGVFSSFDPRGDNTHAMSWRSAANIITCPWNKTYSVGANDDFTWEGWFYLVSADTSRTIYSDGTSGGDVNANWWTIAGTDTFTMTPDISTTDNEHAVTFPSYGTWFNLAVIRKDGIVAAHLDKDPTQLDPMPNTKAFDFTTELDLIFGGDYLMYCDSLAMTIGYAKDVAELY